MAYYLKGIGDTESRKNEIMPSFDAKILYYIMQNAPGICWTELSKFSVTTVERGVQIGAGMVQAMGYFGISDSPTQLTFIFPSGSAQYARVYAEINLSVTPHQFSIKSTAQSTTSNIPLIQDDLQTAPSGIYQIPLYLLTINSNSTIMVTDERINLAKILQASYCDEVTTTIAGRAINDIFESGSATVRNSILAETATKAQTLEFTETAPTSSPAAGTLQIYKGTSLPGTRYDRVIYLITI